MTSHHENFPCFRHSTHFVLPPKKGKYSCCKSLSLITKETFVWLADWFFSVHSPQRAQESKQKEKIFTDASQDFYHLPALGISFNRLTGEITGEIDQGNLKKTEEREPDTVLHIAWRPLCVITERINLAHRFSRPF